MANNGSMGEMPPLQQLRGRQVGRVLIKMGALSRNKVAECLKIQADNGGTPKLGEILVEQGLIDQGQLQQALAAQRGMEFISIDGMDIPAEVLDKVPAQMANGYRIVPIEYNGATNELVVALDDPENYQAGIIIQLAVGAVAQLYELTVMNAEQVSCNLNASGDGC